MNNKLELCLAHGLRAIVVSVSVALVLTVAGAAAVYAQSSGNFVATVDNTVCSVNTTNGALIPPNMNCNLGNPLCMTTIGGGSLTATIKLPGSLPGLLVTPSLATGLYTDTTNSVFSETAAIVVVVTDQLGSGTPTVLTPNQTCVDTSGTGCTSPSPTCQCGVVYDERFQVLRNSGFVDLTLSTMSAHSFNFTEGSVLGGIHTIKMNWYFGCDNGTGMLSTGACTSIFIPNTAAACAGPGTLTVQQVQNFQHDSQIQTTGPTGP